MAAGEEGGEHLAEHRSVADDHLADFLLDRPEALAEVFDALRGIALGLGNGAHSISFMTEEA